MNVEVLLSAMNQTDMGIAEKSNIKSDVLIINQCNANEMQESDGKYGKIRMISTTERGLSRSRNMALKNATGDICILCDDDEFYMDDYVKNVTEAFETIPDADVIIFNVGSFYEKQEKCFKHIKRVPFYKTYGSAHIAFRRKSIIDNNITFNNYFGTGSGMYLMAEDSLFCREIHRKKLKMYVYPAIIAKWLYKESTWFTGFHEKYFYDVGAYLSEAYPRLKHIFKWYYLYKMTSLSNLSSAKMMKSINNGMDGYRKKLNYEDYFHSS